MQQQENHDVAIFWDFDNYRPASNVSGYEIVDNIRCVAHTFGSVKLFRAYQALPPTGSSQFSTLKSELQASGVSFIGCPHNDRKDAADKILIVDMIAHAIDNPAPSTIILISGDRDFSYAVSILRFRRYRVVIISPTEAHPSLTAQASVHLDWHIEVMGQINHDAGSPSTNPNPKNPRPPRTPSRRRADSTTSRHSASRSHDTDPTDDNIYSDYDPPLVICHNIPQVNGYGHKSPSPPTPRKPSLPPKGQVTAYFSELSSKAPSPPATNGLAGSAPPPTALGPISLNCGHSTQDVRTETALQKAFPFSEPESASQPFPKAREFPSITDTASDGISQQPDALPTVVQIPLEQAPSPIHPAKTPLLTPAPVKPAEASAPAPNPVLTAPQVTASVTPSAKRGSSAPPSSTSTNLESATTGPSTSRSQGNNGSRTIPAPFVTLVNVLDTRVSQGTNTFSRTELGGILCKSKGLYQQAGVSTFAAYITMAVSQGIVVVGGNANTAYVALRPEWYGAGTIP